MRHLVLRIKFSSPPATPEFLTKDFPSATRSRMEILTKENLVEAKPAPTAISRTFTPSVRRIRFLFLDQVLEVKSADLGVGGGELILRLPRGKNFAPVLPLNYPHHEGILGII